MVLIMSRKKVFLLLVSFVFMMSLFANFVSAQEKSGLEGAFDTIRKLFGFLPEVITLEKLVGGDAAAVFWAKFLVWLLLFAVIYFGAGFIFKEQKRIAIVVALVISIISTLLIPNEIIMNIFQTYGLVAGILLWFIPLGAALYLNHKIQNRWLRVLILFIALIILMNINATLGKISGLGAWFDYFGLLLGIVLIMFLWNLFAAFGGEDRAEGARGWAGDKAKDAWDWATRQRKREGASGTAEEEVTTGPVPPDEERVMRKAAKNAKRVVFKEEKYFMRIFDLAKKLVAAIKNKDTEGVKNIFKKNKNF